ncbi:hypothetical protein TBS_19460 [Thermobispora bispora]|jgi:hypothetical protein|uniref:Uncharacterized protein n=1 Tax=Thermobispora bispora (strain ATCC 19993 / DSM 43833 / CBS 139.67 / JCM 10125 / KCTC 9307 / NBRC 14880 / R51) TaxID=469371 RepID=D6Y2R0_THEBD|nr:hypothetical protein [Thermobispora bispora]ADG86871.1 hypothetical protein Tbis_0138 [Thermobispora bispora DSM 43833]MBO2475131.1 hypothetical protein [Actinomycetales bacterium]MDI9581057.1 hypothetical protein [Thermobispora sp.]QSI46861.1 hypothetical protein CYL17_02575 [Thermobispora bispora]
MPAFKKILAGLALGTALTGGALTLGATAASATAPTGNFGPCFDNNVFFNDCNNFWNNSNFWTSNCWNDSYDDSSAFVVSNGTATISFFDETHRDSYWSNSGWFNNNGWFNNTPFFNDCGFGGFGGCGFGF